MKAWMAIAAMLVGVGAPGVDRVVPLPVYAAEQVADQAAQVLAAMRTALGGTKLEQVKAISIEGPFRREMGQRQIEGTVILLLQGPDRMRKSEDTEFPGGMSVERIMTLAGDRSWEDTENRGGMGGGRQFMMRGPGGAELDPAAIEKVRTTRLQAEMQRWMLALLATPTGEVAYAGVAESPDGKADTIDMKDARGQSVRLFVDQATHLPLMIAYQEMRPRMMLRGGPGERRGPGGRGADGPGGAGPGAGPGPSGSGAPAGERPSPEEMQRRRESMPPPAPSAVQMSLGDYKTVDGVKLPGHIGISVDGAPTEEWTLEKIKINPAVKADVFEKKQ